jgi:hypothetical protein
MRKRLGSVLRIGLSKTGATVVHTSGWLQIHSEVLAEWAGSEEECATPEIVISKLGVLLKDVDCARMPARVVLSDTWVRRWMVTPPQNVSSLADCQAAAMARFQTLFGEPMSGWHLAADWNARQPFLACAVPQSLLAALKQVASEHGLVLLEVAPQFVVAWNRWRKHLHAGAWFGVMQHKVLAFAVLGQNGLDAARDVTLLDEAMRDQHRVPEILAREALRLNVPMPPEIRLCGQIPAHWAMQKIGGITFIRLDQNQPANAHQPAAGASPSNGMSPMLSPLVSLALTGTYP